MILTIANLPARVNATDLMVEFHVNVTKLEIVDRSSTVKEIRVKIPRSSIARIVSIRVHRPDGPPLTFENKFEYLPAPRPTITRVVPTTASIETQSQMRISVKNFPMVSDVNDLKLYFQFASGEKAYAAVRDYVYSGSKDAAMRDVQIDILSPISSVREGNPKIVVFNQNLGETISAVLETGGVKFVDPLNPQLSRMTSSDGNIGIDDIAVPISGAELTIIVDKAPRRADVLPSSYSLVVGGVVQDIASADVSEGRQATIVFSTFAQLTAGTQQGFVVFGEALAECIADCCSACPSKTVAFELNFFDDTVPLLTVLSDLSGPETGGDIVKMEISNFPLVANAGDISVLVGPDREYVEGVSVLSSTPEKTTLLMVTPTFNVESDTRLDITIEATVDASLFVSFSYLGKLSLPCHLLVGDLQTSPDVHGILANWHLHVFHLSLVLAVQPLVKDFVPTAGLATGGQLVLLQIDYFEVIPAVVFGGPYFCM